MNGKKAMVHTTSKPDQTDESTSLGVCVCQLLDQPNTADVGAQFVDIVTLVTRKETSKRDLRFTNPVCC